MVTVIGRHASRATSALVDTAGWGTGGSAAQQGWSRVLHIPASELVAGHTYLVIASGVVGDFFYHDPKLRWKSAWLAFRTGGATYYNLGTCHRQPAGFPLWDMDYDYQRRQQRGGYRGFPVLMTLEFVMPGTAEDIELIGRVTKASQNDPSTGTFKVDNPSLLAFDLTEIAADADMEAFHNRNVSGLVGGSTIPWRTQTPDTRANIGTTLLSGTYLVGHAACISPGNTTETTQSWLRENSNPAILTFTRGSGIAQPVSPQDLDHCRLWAGQQGLRTYGAAGKTWQTQHQHIASSGSVASRLHVAVAYAVKLHDDMNAWSDPAGKGQALFFFGERTSSLTPLEKALSIGYPSRMLIHGVCGDIQPVRAHWPRIEIDGAETQDPHLYVHAMPGALTNAFQTRVLPLTLEGGDHVLRLRGIRHHQDGGVPGTRDRGMDAQIYGFGLEIDYVPPVDPDETKGAVAQIVPLRETLVASASLPQLPIEPSYVLPRQDHAEIRRLEIPARGYVITSPRFLALRDSMELSFQGLSQTNRDTLAAWLEALPTDAGGGAFRWTPEGELDELILIPDGDSYSEARGPDGHFEVHFAASKLVFLAP